MIGNVFSPSGAALADASASSRRFPPGNGSCRSPRRARWRRRCWRPNSACSAAWPARGTTWPELVEVGVAVAASLSGHPQNRERSGLIPGGREPLRTVTTAAKTACPPAPSWLRADGHWRPAGSAIKTGRCHTCNHPGRKSHLCPFRRSVRSPCARGGDNVIGGGHSSAECGKPLELRHSSLR